MRPVDTRRSSPGPSQQQQPADPFPACIHPGVAADVKPAAAPQGCTAHGEASSSFAAPEARCTAHPGPCFLTHDHPTSSSSPSVSHCYGALGSSPGCSPQRNAADPLLQQHQIRPALQLLLQQTATAGAQSAAGSPPAADPDIVHPPPLPVDSPVATAPNPSAHEAPYPAAWLQQHPADPPCPATTCISDVLPPPLPLDLELRPLPLAHPHPHQQHLGAQHGSRQRLQPAWEGPPPKRPIPACGDAGASHAGGRSGPAAARTGEAPDRTPQPSGTGSGTTGEAAATGGRGGGGCQTEASTCQVAESATAQLPGPTAAPGVAGQAAGQVASAPEPGAAAAAAALGAALLGPSGGLLSVGMGLLGPGMAMGPDPLFLPPGTLDPGGAAAAGAGGVGPIAASAIAVAPTAAAAAVAAVPLAGRSPPPAASVAAAAAAGAGLAVAVPAAAGKPFAVGPSGVGAGGDGGAGGGGGSTFVMPLRPIARYPTAAPAVVAGSGTCGSSRAASHTSEPTHGTVAGAAAGSTAAPVPPPACGAVLGAPRVSEPGACAGGGGCRVQRRSSSGQAVACGGVKSPAGHLEAAAGCAAGAGGGAEGGGVAADGEDGDEDPMRCSSDEEQLPAEDAGGQRRWQRLSLGGAAARPIATAAAAAAVTGGQRDAAVTVADDAKAAGVTAQPAGVAAAEAAGAAAAGSAVAAADPEGASGSSAALHWQPPAPQPQQPTPQQQQQQQQGKDGAAAAAAAALYGQPHDAMSYYASYLGYPNPYMPYMAPWGMFPGIPGMPPFGFMPHQLHEPSVQQQHHHHHHQHQHCHDGSTPHASNHRPAAAAAGVAAPDAEGAAAAVPHGMAPGVPFPLPLAMPHFFHMAMLQQHKLQQQQQQHGGLTDGAPGAQLLRHPSFGDPSGKGHQPHQQREQGQQTPAAHGEGTAKLEGASERQAGQAARTEQQQEQQQRQSQHADLAPRGPGPGNVENAAEDRMKLDAAAARVRGAAAAAKPVVPPVAVVPAQTHGAPLSHRMDEQQQQQQELGPQTHPAELLASRGVPRPGVDDPAGPLAAPPPQLGAPAGGPVHGLGSEVPGRALMAAPVAGGHTVAQPVAAGADVPVPREPGAAAAAAAPAAAPAAACGMGAGAGGSAFRHPAQRLQQHQQQPIGAECPTRGATAAESYKYIVQVGDKWRAQVGHTEGGMQRKYYSCYVRSAARAAKDADMLLYKLRGPSFPLNFPLTDTERRGLDSMTLQELLHLLHPTQDPAAMQAAAALLDLSRPNAPATAAHTAHPPAAPEATPFSSGPVPAAIQPPHDPDTKQVPPTQSSWPQLPAPVSVSISPAAGVAGGAPHQAADAGTPSLWRDSTTASSPIGQHHHQHQQQQQQQQAPVVCPGGAGAFSQHAASGVASEGGGMRHSAVAAAAVAGSAVGQGTSRPAEVQGPRDAAQGGPCGGGGGGGGGSGPGPPPHPASAALAAAAAASVPAAAAAGEPSVQTCHGPGCEHQQKQHQGLDGRWTSAGGCRVEPGGAPQHGEQQLPRLQPAQQPHAAQQQQQQQHTPPRAVGHGGEAMQCEEDSDGAGSTCAREPGSGGRSSDVGEEAHTTVKEHVTTVATVPEPQDTAAKAAPTAATAHPLVPLGPHIPAMPLLPPHALLPMQLPLFHASQPTAPPLLPHQQHHLHHPHQQQQHQLHADRQPPTQHPAPQQQPQAATAAGTQAPLGMPMAAPWGPAPPHLLHHPMGPCAHDPYTHAFALSPMQPYGLPPFFMQPPPMHHIPPAAATAGDGGGGGAALPPAAMMMGMPPSMFGAPPFMAAAAAMASAAAAAAAATAGPGGGCMPPSAAQAANGLACPVGGGDAAGHAPGGLLRHPSCGADAAGSGSGGGTQARKRKVATIGCASRGGSPQPGGAPATDGGDMAAAAAAADGSADGGGGPAECAYPSAAGAATFAAVVAAPPPPPMTAAAAAGEQMAAAPPRVPASGRGNKGHGGGGGGNGRQHAKGGGHGQHGKGGGGGAGGAGGKAHVATAAAATGAGGHSADRPPFRYIVRIGNKWRAQVGHTEDGVQRKYYSCYVEDPRVAAKDADKILYKLRGVAAVANLPLSDTERAVLDALTLEGLMRTFKEVKGEPRGGVGGQH